MSVSSPSNHVERLRRASVFVFGSCLSIVLLAVVAFGPASDSARLGGGGVLAAGVVGYQAIVGPRSIPSLVGTALLTTALVGGSWLVLQTVPLWQASGLLVGVGAVLSYGLARVQQVALGAVEELDGG